MSLFTERSHICVCVWCVCVYVCFFIFCLGANIFMSSNTVKLGDFGLSVQLKYGDRMQSGIPQHDAGTVRKRVSY